MTISNATQTKHASQFVFGYGSLICRQSRALTVQEQAKKVATPVVVKGMERIWSKRIPSRGMMAMGIRYKLDAACLGVLMHVSKQELKEFDHREIGYNRVPIDIDSIEKVPFLSDGYYYQEDDHSAFLRAKSKKTTSDNKLLNLQVWVYVPEDSQPPNRETPIVQSYVDTILRGCLSINEQFAKDFLTTTKGWHPTEFGQDHDADDNNDAGLWVDDRKNPIYPRGDAVWARNHAKELDEIIQKHLPERFRCRILLEDSKLARF